LLCSESWISQNSDKSPEVLVEVLKQAYPQLRIPKFVNIPNNLFLKLLGINQILGWVDIENAYYSLLLHWAKNNSSKKEVSKLNSEFAEIKKYLEIYLSFVIESRGKSKIELQYDKNVFSGLNLAAKNSVSTTDDLMVLNFNYTSTFQFYLDRYLNSKNPRNKEYAQINYIHGQLNSLNNPIIFGYGDERHRDFELVLQNGNNELLRNVKHYKYLQNTNLKILMNFLDGHNGNISRQFDIHLIGHSCGNSDRALFNMIFEHPNLYKNGIKIHLADYEDEESKRLYYEDISIQISRTLNESGSVRTKLLNYQDCLTMPSVEKLKSRV
jgi:hypothetical protein